MNLNFIAVAYNGEVLDKDDFSRVTLNEGDVLEIVRPLSEWRLTHFRFSRANTLIARSAWGGSLQHFRSDQKASGAKTAGRADLLRASPLCNLGSGMSVISPTTWWLLLHTSRTLQTWAARANSSPQLLAVSWTPLCCSG